LQQKGHPALLGSMGSQRRCDTLASKRTVLPQTAHRLMRGSEGRSTWALTKAAARQLAVNQMQSDNGPKDDLELVLLDNSAP
jgi:hypothetical protein